MSKPAVLNYHGGPGGISSKTRFQGWCTLVAAIIFFDAFLVRDFHSRSFYEFFPITLAVVGFLMLVLWWLLDSTPLDAIRLKRLNSLVLIGSVTFILALVTAAAKPSFGPLAWVTAWAAVASLALARAWHREKSLWWATLFAWHPAPMVLAALSGPTSGKLLLLLACCGCGVAAFHFEKRWVAPAGLLVAWVASLVFIAF